RRRIARRRSGVGPRAARPAPPADPRAMGRRTVGRRGLRPLRGRDRRLAGEPARLVHPRRVRRDRRTHAGPAARAPAGARVAVDRALRPPLAAGCLAGRGARLQPSRAGPEAPVNQRETPRILYILTAVTAAVWLLVRLMGR